VAVIEANTTAFGTSSHECKWSLKQIPPHLGGFEFSHG